VICYQITTSLETASLILSAKYDAEITSDCFIATAIWRMYSELTAHSLTAQVPLRNVDVTWMAVGSLSACDVELTRVEAMVIIISLK
jgi:hypothetical protein